MRLVVINHLTLDGVMQGPGRPDEDTRGGFSHGGWGIPGGDEVMAQALGSRMDSGQRMFGHEDHALRLRLVESTATTTGVSSPPITPPEGRDSPGVNAARQ